MLVLPFFAGPTKVVTHPQSAIIFVSSFITLSCEATGSDPISYRWRRVNGEISSERATGVTTSTLTISPVREDEDKYYCVTTNGGLDGMKYSDRSQVAQVIVYGKGFCTILSTKWKWCIFKSISQVQPVMSSHCVTCKGCNSCCCRPLVLDNDKALMQYNTKVRICFVTIPHQYSLKNYRVKDQTKNNAISSSDHSAIYPITVLYLR